LAKSFTPEFEVEVLRNLVIDPQFLKSSINVVRTDYFTSETNARAFNVISQSYVKTRQAPSRIGFLSALVQAEESAIKVKSQDKDKLILAPCQALTDKLFSNTPKTLDVETAWLDFCKQREIENVHLLNLQGLESGEIDHHTAVENVNKAYRRINTNNQGGINPFDNLDTFAQRMKEQKLKKIFTGFNALDIRCGGGYNIRTLSTVIAQSKGGKSMKLLNTGFTNVAAGKNVMHFTVEISEEETELRYASRISGIPMDDVTKRAGEMAEKCAQFALEHKGQYFIKGWPSGTVGVVELRNYLYWLESEHGFRPDVILVDYGDCLLPRTSYKEERLKTKEIWTDLRAMAFEFNAHVATASQTKREGFDRPIIRMQDVAEDIQKVNISDYITTLCKTQDEDQNGKARLFLAGSRCARAGLVVPLRFDWSYAFLAESNDKLQQTEVFK
jgi:replicative DNA helicase